MVYNIVLPKYLQPYKVKNLIRLGKDNDGGYIVNGLDVVNTTNLISLGVSFDYSFEADFLKLNNKTIIRTFDGSVGNKYYRKKCKHRIKAFFLKPNKINLIKVYDILNQFLSFIKFYKFNLFSKIKHTEKFVTPDISIFRNFEKNYGYKPEFIEFKDVITQNLNSVFLSIDIEGGEYEILEDIYSYRKKLTGLNIEFHDVQDNLEKIKLFIKKFDLKLVHTHINNFGPIINGIPSVIELSFSSNLITNQSPNLKHTNKLPIKLDQPNKSDGIDYSVTFN